MREVCAGGADRGLRPFAASMRTRAASGQSSDAASRSTSRPMSAQALRAVDASEITTATVPIRMPMPEQRPMAARRVHQEESPRDSATRAKNKLRFENPTQVRCVGAPRELLEERCRSRPRHLVVAQCFEGVDRDDLTLLEHPAVRRLRAHSSYLAQAPQVIA